MSEFGQRWKARRLAKGLTQREVAKILGIGHTYISHIEHGRCNPPSVKTIRAFCRITESDPEELLLLTRHGKDAAIEYAIKELTAVLEQTEQIFGATDAASFLPGVVRALARLKTVT